MAQRALTLIMSTCAIVMTLTIAGCAGDPQKARKAEYMRLHEHFLSEAKHCAAIHGDPQVKTLRASAQNHLAKLWELQNRYRMAKTDSHTQAQLESIVQDYATTIIEGETNATALRELLLPCVRDLISTAEQLQELAPELLAKDPFVEPLAAMLEVEQDDLTEGLQPLLEPVVGPATQVLFTRQQAGEILTPEIVRQEYVKAARRLLDSKADQK